jgi:hypothetical protein
MEDIKGVLRQPLTMVGNMSDKDKRMERGGAPPVRLSKKDYATGWRYRSRQQGNKENIKSQP